MKKAHFHPRKGNDFLRSTVPDPGGSHLVLSAPPEEQCSHNKQDDAGSDGALQAKADTVGKAVRSSGCIQLKYGEGQHCAAVGKAQDNILAEVPGSMGSHGSPWAVHINHHCREDKWGQVQSL